MKGDEDKLFDDFLRKSLGNYQVMPPPALWKGILQKIPVRRIIKFPFGSGNTGLIGFISGGIILTSVVVYQWNTRNEKAGLTADTSGTIVAQTVPSNHNDDNSSNIINLAESFTKALSPSNKILIETDFPETHIEQSKKDPTIEVKNTTHPSAPQEAIPMNSVPADLTTLSEPRAAVSVNQTGDQTSLGAPDLHVNNSLQLTDDITLAGTNRALYFEMSRKAGGNASLLRKTLPETSRSFKILTAKRDYARYNNEFCVGAWYYPEWLNKPDAYRYNKTRQTAGFTASFKKSPYSLETGLGLMKEKAWQDYDITYRQLLGTYNDLHFISFDSLGNPTFSYLTDSVFDPENKSQSHSKLASYTYLQIPLLLGFEKKLGRNSLTLKTGPVFSLLLSSLEEKPLLDADKNILFIDGDHPNRLLTSWQWYLGISYSYAITDRISFFLEPAVRGYLNTPYERKRKVGDNPVYFGIRSGIMLQLKNPFDK